MAASGMKKASNIFVWIILGLLIIGLAGFGIGNFGGTVRTVASVGDTEIDAQSYARALQQRIQTLSQQTGQAITVTQARELGIEAAVLQELLAGAALDESSRRAGISVGDAAVSEQVLAIPAFSGLNGQFDRDAYEFTLTRNGLSVAEFEDGIRRDISRNLLQMAVAGGITPNPVYLDTLMTYLGERRDISLTEVTPSDLAGALPAPTDAEARAHYEANPGDFTLPERRRISYVWLTPAMLTDSVEVDEASLRALYDQRAAQYRQPERRLVERLVFPDQAAADAAMAQVEAAEASFDDLVAGRGLTLDDVDLGEVTREDLGDAADAIFALADTGLAGPLPSSLGPALYRVNAILSAQEVSFEEAMPELREDLAAERSRRVIDAEIEALDDLLAGGATLEELARESEMTFGTLDWTGEPGDGIAAYTDFARAANRVGADDFPEIEILDDGGIFALRLDEVIPPTLMAFETVEEDAFEGARLAKRMDTLRQRAAAIAASLEGGDWSDQEIEPRREQGLTRRDFIEDLPETLLEEVFALQDGAIAQIDGDEQVIVLRLDGVRPPAEDDPTRAMLEATLLPELAQSMGQDVLTELARAVEQEAGISINQSGLNAVHTQMP